MIPISSQGWSPIAAKAADEADIVEVQLTKQRSKCYLDGLGMYFIGLSYKQSLCARAEDV